jgi:hypothetical protein
MNPESLQGFEIKVENHLAYHYDGVLGFGACLPAGQIRTGDGLHLEDRDGKEYPLEWRPLLLDASGAVSWAQFHFPVALQKRQFRHFTVQPGALAEYSRLHLETTSDGIRVRNGDELWTFHWQSPLGLAALSRAGVLLLDGTASSAEMAFASDIYRVREPLAFSVAQSNSLMVLVEAAGELQGDDGDGIYFRLRYKIQLGKPGCDLNVLFSNRRACDEELSLQSFRISFGLSTPVSSSLVRQSSFGNDCSPRDYEIAGGVEIRGGALADTTPLEIPRREELWPFFRKRDWKKLFSRVAPFCGVRCAQGGVLFSWQRATRLETGAFTAHRQCAMLELISPTDSGRAVPQGFSRSFDFSITPLDQSADSQEVFRCASLAEYSPLVAVHPQWFIKNRVEEMERVLPFRPDLHPRYEKQLWREYAMDYFSGFYHYGDYPSGRGPLQTRVESRDYIWNNNEEDHLKGLAWMLMRTGDPSYREDMEMCARHLLEVDRIAFSSHPLQNGVFIAHAKNHFDGAGYPSHCWAEGLSLYYKLSGDEDARAAFFTLCDCLLLWAQQPDHRRFTDAREMGVSVTNLAHAYKLSGNDEYLRAARIYLGHWRKQMDEDGGLYYQKGAHYIPYAEYVAVEGLWDFYELIGGEDVRDLLLRIIEWIWCTQLDQSGVYDARSTSEAFLHIFYIAWKLTSDEVWLERGRPGLDAALSQSAMHPLLKFNNNGAYYHQAMQRGWFRDELVPLEPCRSTRAVFRTYSEPLFVWGE